MADAGRLIYNSTSGALAFKHGNGSLAFKAEVQQIGVTTVSFSWAQEGNDLDICAYWESEPELKVGWSYQASGGTYRRNGFVIEWSGDIREQLATEWTKISKDAWDSSQRFIVHFNFFGYSSSYPASVCSVIASQAGGETFVKQDQNCSTRPSSKAETGDPRCILTFDSKGRLTGIQ